MTNDRTLSRATAAVISGPELNWTKACHMEDANILMDSASKRVLARIISTGTVSSGSERSEAELCGEETVTDTFGGSHHPYANSGLPHGGCQYSHGLHERRVASTHHLQERDRAEEKGLERSCAEKRL